MKIENNRRRGGGAGGDAIALVIGLAVALFVLSGGIAYGLPLDTYRAEAEMNVQLPDGTVTPFTLLGTSTILTSTSTPADPDGNGREGIPTEIILLDLTGGGMTMSLRSGTPSLGKLEELGNPNPGSIDFPADSFFDVFYDIDLPSMPGLRGSNQFHPQAQVNTWPLLVTTIFPTPVTNVAQLLDANGNSTGISVSGFKLTLTPATTTPPPPPPPPPTTWRLDHFKCYNASSPYLVSDLVFLFDQFARNDQLFWRDTVGRTDFFCNPTSKVHGNASTTVFDNNSHLTWYRIRSVLDEKFRQRNVLVKNQFTPATGTPLRVVSPEYLAVPTNKMMMDSLPTGHSFPSDLDHFRCYSVKGKHSPEKVTLKDQFSTTTSSLDAVVMEPRYLCNPSYKAHFTGFGTNGSTTMTVTPTKHWDDHLVCYRLRNSHEAPRRLTVGNQFGIQNLSTGIRNTICVPSEKTELSGNVSATDIE